MKTLFFLLLVLVGSVAGAMKPEVMLQREDVIWGFDFLSDGRIIFTERGGVLAVYDPAKRETKVVSGAPEVRVRGQGGLLDVAVHPKTGEIYLSYSEKVGSGEATTALGKGELKDGRLVGFKKIFSAATANDNTIHFGSRILFKDGFIYLSVGDRDKRKLAQDLNQHTGKILRLKEDGTAADGNPFAGRAGAKPEIWSYGHRNPQGMAFHPVTGELWEVEFGPRGGDELNLIKPGLNYGWPVITYGKEYWGPSIGEGKSKTGMEQPVAHWVPSISPSGMAIYDGDKFPEWKGNFFLACLASTHIRRLVVDAGKVTSQEELLKGFGRFRHVRQGPDGYLYFSTDDGKLGRVVK